MYFTNVTDKTLTKGHYRGYQSRLKQNKSSSGDEKLRSLVTSGRESLNMAILYRK